MNGERPRWDEYFMEIAVVVAKRSTCVRRQVGAVIVKDQHIVSTGYNGAPKNVPHCLNLGCMREKLMIPSGERHELCRGSHAEMNAIAQAAAHGVSTSGGVIYCTCEPCAYCTKAIISSGLARVVYMKEYPDDLARELRACAGLLEEKLNI